MATQKRHIVMIPFPVTSHPFPLASLARRLAVDAPDAIFSFMNTSSSNNALFYSGTVEPLPYNLKVYDIAGTSPWDGETTTITPSLVEKLDSFLEVAVASFENAIEAAVKSAGVRVTCLLTDALMTFSFGIAEKLQAKWIALWVPIPSILPAFIYRDAIVQLLKDAKGEDLDIVSQKISKVIPGFSDVNFADLPHGLRIPNPSPTKYFRIFNEDVERLLPHADAVVLNSFEELIPPSVTSALRSKLQLLLHAGCQTIKFKPSDPTLLSPDHTGSLELLDEQKPRSAVYIGFGTFAGLSPQEIYELAQALEESATPYIWSLKDNLKTHLPLGFVERTRKHGRVLDWAPQREVLSHPSIGAHISHCGFHSIFESIDGEVPLICKAVLFDHKINARMVEELWGIGVKVEGPITKYMILKYLKMVLGDEGRGKELRETIRALREVLIKSSGPDGSASKDYKTLVDLISIAL